MKTIETLTWYMKDGIKRIPLEVEFDFEERNNEGMYLDILAVNSIPMKYIENDLYYAIIDYLEENAVHRLREEYLDKQADNYYTRLREAD